MLRLGTYPTCAHFVRTKRLINSSKLCPCLSGEEVNINHLLLRCIKHTDLRERWLKPLNDIFGICSDAEAVAICNRVDKDVIYQSVSSFLWGIWPLIKLGLK